MKSYSKKLPETYARGLSLAERGAYEMLMDQYYATERALPSDPVAARRIAGAQTDLERATVDWVIKRLFTLGDDGLLHHKQADATIAKYLACIEKKSAGGKKGSATWNKIQAERAAAYDARYVDGQPVVKQKGKGITDPARTAERAKRRAAVEISLRIIDYLNEKAGTRYEGTRAHVVLLTSRILQDGADEAKMRAVVDMKVAEWGKDLERRRYLSPDTLFNATKWGKYVGQLDQREVLDQARAEAATQKYVIVMSYGEGEALGKGVAAQKMTGDIDPLAIAKRAVSKFGDVVRKRAAKWISVVVDEKEVARYKAEDLTTSARAPSSTIERPNLEPPGPDAASG